MLDRIDELTDQELARGSGRWQHSPTWRSRNRELAVDGMDGVVSACLFGDLLPGVPLCRCRERPA